MKMNKKNSPTYAVGKNIEETSAPPEVLQIMLSKDLI